MKPKASVAISYSEIHHLAWLNWRKDGCPEGQDMEYWLAAEEMIRETLQSPLARKGRLSTTRKTKLKKTNRATRAIRSRESSQVPAKIGRLPIFRLAEARFDQQTGSD